MPVSVETTPRSVVINPGEANGKGEKRCGWTGEEVGLTTGLLFPRWSSIPRTPSLYSKERAVAQGPCFQFPRNRERCDQVKQVVRRRIVPLERGKKNWGGGGQTGFERPNRGVPAGGPPGQTPEPNSEHKTRSHCEDGGAGGWEGESEGTGRTCVEYFFRLLAVLLRNWGAGEAGALTMWCLS